MNSIRHRGQKAAQERLFCWYIDIFFYPSVMLMGLLLLSLLPGIEEIFHSLFTASAGFLTPFPTVTTLLGCIIIQKLNFSPPWCELSFHGCQHWFPCSHPACLVPPTEILKSLSKLTNSMRFWPLHPHTPLFWTINTFSISANRGFLSEEMQQFQPSMKA